MSGIRYLALLLIIAVSTAHADATVFPKDSPKNLKAAESAGLHRLTTEELKAFIPGSMEVLGRGAGKPKLRTYKPDGVFEVQSWKINKGTWRLDAGANTWCRTVYKEKKREDVEQCFAVFRAPDGVHYFDYDVGDSFHASTWRPQSK
ncbi:MAG: hypothetical protein AMJ68_04020 [Acidithiobacillales bacterium SG8_45]|nr:MAG: hypothetical protein AMJ68_04020 [Acidithiobacillales bacterium SG8_45]